MIADRAALAARLTCKNLTELKL